jgi:SAM-dependent methyltransferase
VLNLVREEDRRALFGEIFRVLRHGGRAVVSDIVAGGPVPEHLQRDPQLWSGCVSGAFQETAFLEAFAAAGFQGIEIARRDTAPWRTVEGVEFRAITVRAFKAKQGPCGAHEGLIPVEPLVAVEPVGEASTGCCAPGARR